MTSHDATGRPDWFKAGITVLIGLYFLKCALHPHKWDLLDSFTLIVHEAGHPLFGIFGEFIGMAGGTLMQLIVPIAFIVSFLRQGQPFSSALMWFWLGNSLLYCSVYAADAQAMALPLFGAGDRVHDWNYMLDSTHLLWATPIVSGGFRLFGTLAILTGCYMGLAVAGVRLPSLVLERPHPKPARSSRSIKGRGFRRSDRSQ